jgi:ribonuclease P protein component
MLPSKQRLSRTDFTAFVAQKDVRSVYNQLGTLKYRKNPVYQVSIVISSKHEKRAIYRNTLKRRLYSLFRLHTKNSLTNGQYVLYCSKQASKLPYSDVKALFDELLKKTP